MINQFQGGRHDLPKVRDIPNHVGNLITQGISVNSSYSSDVKVGKLAASYRVSWELYLITRTPCINGFRSLETLATEINVSRPQMKMFLAP